MKTDQEVKQLIFEIEDEIQFVSSCLEKASSMAEALPHHDKRRKLQAQHEILLEVLK